MTIWSLLPWTVTSAGAFELAPWLLASAQSHPMAEDCFVRTYYFDMQDGVPIRDTKGLQFPNNTGAIEHSKELARRFSHDARRKDSVHSIIVLDESSKEIHREPVHQDERRHKAAITFEKIE